MEQPSYKLLRMAMMAVLVMRVRAKSLATHRPNYGALRILKTMQTQPPMDSL